MATHRVGGEVDAFCTRCKMDLAHTILAMVGTKIVRVRCNTCGGDHVFRSKPGVTERTGGRTPRAPREKAEKKEVIAFEQQLAGKDVANAPHYSARDTYALDQVLQHPTFGVGLVTAVRGDKVDVAFRAETKTLVHARGGTSAPRPAYHPPSAAAVGPADKPQAHASEGAGTPEPPAQE
jgi:hypothetical protein